MVRRSAISALALILLTAGCGKTDSAADALASPTAAVVEPAATPPTAAPIRPSEPAAAASVASPAPDELPDRLPHRLQALGTEPFWSVAIDGATLRYSTPEDQAGQTFTAVRQDAPNSRTYAGKVAGKQFEMRIMRERCSDGMSDTEYPFSASLSIAGERHQGCARQ